MEPDLRRWTRHSGNYDVVRLTYNTRGIVLGWDVSLGEGSVCMLARYSNANLTVNQRAASGDVESYHLGFYWGCASEQPQPARWRRLKLALFGNTA